MPRVLGQPLKAGRNAARACPDRSNHIPALATRTGMVVYHDTVRDCLTRAGILLGFGGKGAGDYG